MPSKKKPYFYFVKDTPVYLSAVSYEQALMAVKFKNAGHPFSVRLYEDTEKFVLVRLLRCIEADLPGFKDYALFSWHKLPKERRRPANRMHWSKFHEFCAKDSDHEMDEFLGSKFGVCFKTLLKRYPSIVAFLRRECRVVSNEALYQKLVFENVTLRATFFDRFGQ